jgi:hypothetical protein
VRFGFGVRLNGENGQWIGDARLFRERNGFDTSWRYDTRTPSPAVGTLALLFLRNHASEDPIQACFQTIGQGVDSVENRYGLAILMMPVLALLAAASGGIAPLSVNLRRHPVGHSDRDSCQKQLFPRAYACSRADACALFFL